jgi:hypothetical protein
MQDLTNVSLEVQRSSSSTDLRIAYVVLCWLYSILHRLGWSLSNPDLVVMPYCRTTWMRFNNTGRK